MSTEDRFTVDIPLGQQPQNRSKEIANEGGRTVESVVTEVIALFILQRTLEKAAKERAQ